MKIQLISDLHLEFFPLGYCPEEMLTDADVLVIAGDMTVGKQSVEYYLKFFADHYPYVIYVPGNHEYYGKSISELDDVKAPDNVHYLNPGTVRLPTREGHDVTFIGATLWTNFDNIKGNEKIAGKYITDFKRIRGFDTEQAKVFFNKHLKYIENAIRVLPEQKVIITHFLPGKHCVHPRWASNTYPTHELNSYFAPNVNILDTTSGVHGVTHWLFGHTHDSIDVNYNGIRYLANPYGYFNHEVNPMFDPRLQLVL